MIDKGLNELIVILNGLTELSCRYTKNEGLQNYEMLLVNRERSFGNGKTTALNSVPLGVPVLDLKCKQKV